MRRWRPSPKGKNPPPRKAKAKWTQLEAIVGHPARLKDVAADIIRHFEQRLEVFDGKAMIVCISRRVAVELYGRLPNCARLVDPDKRKGAIKW